MSINQRYVALDGLRGIAALAVLFFHLEWFAFGRPTLFRHGYLSVDFFFLLSGFVISAAYESKFLNGTLRLPRFVFAVRVVRLWPLLILGATLGFVVDWARPLHAGVTFKTLVQQVLLIPSLHMAGMVYPLNNNQWSLGFELLANIVHQVILRRLGVRVLGVVCAISAVAIVICAASFGTLDLGSNISVLAGGLARVSFSYTLGIIIYRLHRSGRVEGVKWGWWFSASLLTLAICLPTTRNTFLGEAHDVLAVLVVFPIIVCLALKPIGRPRVSRVCEWLGAISYAVYILQAPIQTASEIFARHWSAALHLIAGPLVALVVIVFSWAMYRFYDEPLRTYLGRLLKVPKTSLAYTAP